MKTIPIPAGHEDGAEIVARVFGPVVPERGSVVIAGAIGVPQRYYQRFAQWLGEQGWRVTTFDYEGQGESWTAGRSLRYCRADLWTWAANYAAVVAQARAAVPDKPLLLVGHSVGAQLAGLLPQPELVDGLISVAAGSGFRGENAPRTRRLLPLFWDVFVPTATGMLGYFPGRTLRMVGDLPRGVVQQWKRWCAHPEYLLHAEGAAARSRFEAVRFPIYALSVDDDELMTLKGTHSLMGFYPNATRRIERMAPAQAQVARLGHFGFFRDRFQHTLWPLLSDTLARWPEAVADGVGAGQALPYHPSHTPHARVPAPAPLPAAA